MLCRRDHNPTRASRPVNPECAASSPPNRPESSHCSQSGPRPSQTSSTLKTLLQSVFPCVTSDRRWQKTQSRFLSVEESETKAGLFAARETPRCFLVWAEINILFAKSGKPEVCVTATIKKEGRRSRKGMGTGALRMCQTWMLRARVYASTQRRIHVCLTP